VLRLLRAGPAGGVGRGARGSALVRSRHACGGRVTSVTTWRRYRCCAWQQPVSRQWRGLDV